MKTVYDEFKEFCEADENEKSYSIKYSGWEIRKDIYNNISGTKIYNYYLMHNYLHIRDNFATHDRNVYNDMVKEFIDYIGIRIQYNLTQYSLKLRKDLNNGYRR